MAVTKICGKCDREHPATLEYFCGDKRNKSGLGNWCRQCCRATMKKYRQTPAGRLANRKGRRKYYNTITGYLRNVYHNMKRRCNDSRRCNYANYGGRGIKNKFKSLDDFRNYVIDKLQVDPRGLQIDRIDNDGHYEKGNIRFVTQIENLKKRCY